MIPRATVEEPLPALRRASAAPGRWLGGRRGCRPSRRRRRERRGAACAIASSARTAAAGSGWCSARDARARAMPRDRARRRVGRAANDRPMPGSTAGRQNPATPRLKSLRRVLVCLKRPSRGLQEPPHGARVSLPKDPRMIDRPYRLSIERAVFRGIIVSVAVPVSLLHVDETRRTRRNT